MLTEIDILLQDFSLLLMPVYLMKWNSPAVFHARITAGFRMSGENALFMALMQIEWVSIMPERT